MVCYVLCGVLRHPVDGRVRLAFAARCGKDWRGHASWFQTNGGCACRAGVYNWNFVFGIEQIVEWCRAHGVKVMFTFLDNWSPVDSKTAVRSEPLAGILMMCSAGAVYCLCCPF